jgi:hypothetical protein
MHAGHAFINGGELSWNIALDFCRQSRQVEFDDRKPRWCGESQRLIRALGRLFRCKRRHNDDQPRTQVGNAGADDSRSAGEQPASSAAGSD